MKELLQFFILLPLLGFFISLLIPRKKETLISRIVFFTAGIHLLGSFAFFVYWLIIGHPTLDIKQLVVYKTDHFEFFIDLFFDKITAVYVCVGSFLTFLVAVFSRFYMHLEAGYKRFFNTILFFFSGYNVAVLSGNLETLFIGWEIIGISSFLLVGYFRDRYLPVRNSIKVFSVYRVGDAALILAMWLSHHLWNENITFLKIHDDALVASRLETQALMGFFISFMFLIAAAVKSAQIPFSSWLPRAMEGPTPSSAIFYGSLSVHLGVFILLRTFQLWEHQWSIRILIISAGLVTSVIASFTARVQSSVKSQIAYSSIAQIGLIFIEVALGLEILALIHFAGNALLRTYQLLVSPSMLNYLIHEQFYNFVPRENKFSKLFPKKIIYTFYMLSIKEWNLDRFMYLAFLKPLTVAAKLFNFLTLKAAIIFFVLVYAGGMFCLFDKDIIPEGLHHYLPTVFGGIGLIMVLKSYTERENVFMAWVLVIMNHLWVALAIALNDNFERSQTVFYLSGVVVSGLLGFFLLYRLRSLEGNEINLKQFHGYSYKYPGIAIVFLIACLGLAGFPITPTFIGEDLMFSHIHEDQPVLAFFTASSFIICGLSLIRCYSRIFLGAYTKAYHDIAYRSS
ncbi:MAG: hypothetical protein IAF38_04755 [Bacteroidia bacterium]|nr:hypothetical protein [Bacteroidia bacterium]